MALSRKAVDRLAAGFLYLAIAGVVIWAGSALINQSMEVKFYKDYLIKWKICVQRFRVTPGKWPLFTGKNHLEYMRALEVQMDKWGIKPPRSNTTDACCYVLDRIGFPPENIFVLCLRDRLIIYGLSKRTFDKIDKYVDGESNELMGRFVGKSNKKQGSITGIWGI